MHTASLIFTLISLASAVVARRVIPLDETSLTRRDATCPASGSLPQSCINGASPANVDSCCTNTPGGQMLQTQFWDTDPVTGPTNSWTIHGLWPDHCDGTYDATCDPNRQYTNIREILTNGGATEVLSYMDTYWKDYTGQDETFWAHEWGKHGTCISTLETDCYGSSYVQYEEVVEYFERAVALFKTLPTYDWLADAGIVPSTTATYTLAQLQAVANAKFGYDAIWGCSGSSLDEVWYGYTTQGTIESGTFIANGPDGTKSTCPETGIRYVPKTATTTPPVTGVPTGKVFINVYIEAAPTTTKEKRAEATQAVEKREAKPSFLNARQRLTKRGTSTVQSSVVAERQFDPKKKATKRAACTGPLPSGVCQQTCPTGQIAQTDGSCACPDGQVKLDDNTCAVETKDGCLISAGKWYTTGTCAGYTITAVDAETFTMTTSKGPCAVTSAGAISCAAGNTASVFGVDTTTNNILYQGNSNFYAATIASGQTQVTVTTTEAANKLRLRYGPSS
ncbi:ribonuclease T2 [Pseudohyphozyma bogoriensis]|nr:ribonuclease T2 [Pseudohyphozyma bogoriensis]